MGEILTHLALLMPTFSLLYSPQLLPVVLLPVYNAPLPPALNFIDKLSFIFYRIFFLFDNYLLICKIECRATTSVIDFSPGHLRRKTTRPVSYYALFQ